jgi:hypothetical protein
MCFTGNFALTMAGQRAEPLRDRARPVGRQGAELDAETRLSSDRAAFLGA